MPGASAWSPRTSSASRSARPELTIVASWRVNSTTSVRLAEGRRRPIDRPPPPAPFFLPPEVASSRRTGVRFCFLSSAAASLRSFAWIVPSTVLPPGPLAAYLKVVTTGFSGWAALSGKGSVLEGHAQDLLQGGAPARRVEQAHPAQGEHSLTDCFGLDVRYGSAFDDHSLEGVVQPQGLEHRDTAPVPPRAAPAALGIGLEQLQLGDLGLGVADGKQFLLGQVDRLPALVAQLAPQALGADAQEGARDEERVDAHVDQARHRARRVVRVERREHEVAGERGLDRDVGGLRVADLPHQDHVRVLAQD